MPKKIKLVKPDGTSVDLAYPWTQVGHFRNDPAPMGIDDKHEGVVARAYPRGGIDACGDAAAVAKLLAHAPQLAEMLMACAQELNALHAHHYPNCEGGCPSEHYGRKAMALLESIGVREWEGPANA